MDNSNSSKLMIPVLFCSFRNWNKKIKFMRLHVRSWKIFSKQFQKCKIWIFRFSSKYQSRSCFINSSKYKKWIFWIILSISCPWNFFHSTFSFFSKRDWKLLFLAYFSIFNKKIQKIVKIAKFQLNLDHPIFNIFWHLKLRWKAEKPCLTNSDKNF